MEQQIFRINLSSFGFKYGVPGGVNYLWDVRFLPNPYWEEELRPKNGLDRDVSDYVVASTACQGFLQLVRPLLLYLVRQNMDAGKDVLNLAIGCTGGKHRSVAVVEAVKDIVSVLPVSFQVSHRDIEKDC